MPENPTFVPPAERRDYASHDNPLLAAAQDLARAISEVEPDPRYSPQRPQVVIVGGFVRDRLLGLDPKDADIEVYGVSPEKLKEVVERLFGKAKEVGANFGIIKVPIGEGLDLDVSIPRRVPTAGDERSGDLAEADPSVGLVEAARGRDFSMNALAMDAVTGKVFNLFGGEEDIRSRTLRITDVARFREDPLRVLRAMQFVARLGFSVDPESERVMRELVETAPDAKFPPERVTVELEKLLTRSPRPSTGFEFARRIGIVDRFFPEAAALADVPQEPEWHPEGDVWIHTMMVIDAAAKIARRDGLSGAEYRQVLLGALVHDYGKPAKTETIDGRIRSRGHEEAGEEPTRKMCERLAFGKDDVEAAVAIAVNHLKPGVFFRAWQTGELNEKQYVNAIRKLIRRLGKTSWRVLLAASEADHRGRTIPGCDTEPYLAGRMLAETVVAHGLDKEAAKPLLMGRDLIKEFRLVPSKKSGEIFGAILGAVESARDAGEIETRDQALAFVRNYLFNNPL